MILTLLVCAGWTGIGWIMSSRLTRELDVSTRLGVSGLLGLGTLGFLTFFVGLIPGGLSFGMAMPVVGALVGGYGLMRIAKETSQPALPKGGWLVAPALLTVCALMGLIGILAPTDTNEWDSLAYHLAVPKIWIQQGHITFIPFIHQSNFPFAVDNLYIWGLEWGGQSGAKAFQLAFFLLGALAIFGLTRARFGDKSAWIAVVAYATVPTIVWEAGTAYIDLANGLYAGLGIVFAALMIESGERRYAWLAALMLGFGAASKYTALQTIFAVCVVIVAFAFLPSPQNLRPKTQAPTPKTEFSNALLIGIIAVAIASPWLIRNVVNVGNPVYPFFYEKLGARNWDQRRADIYRNEQQLFGVGRTDKGRDPTAIGHAVLGLAYQPGRFVNPAEDKGLGWPLGAFGAAVLAAWFVWMASGRSTKFESSIIATLVLSALMWFFLSQQSRYIVTWAIPLAILAGGAWERLKLGKALGGVVALQAVVSVALLWTLRTSMQQKVVFGDLDPDVYQLDTITFYGPAKDLNKARPGTTKVALYNEVFGFMLDPPYVWANPGHGMLIDYDRMRDGADLVAEFKRLGITDIYVNVGSMGKDAGPWLDATGHNPGVPVPQAKMREWYANWEVKWMALLADAVKKGLIQERNSYHAGFTYFVK